VEEKEDKEGGLSSSRE